MFVDQADDPGFSIDAALGADPPPEWEPAPPVDPVPEDHFQNYVDIRLVIETPPKPINFLIDDRIPMGRGILITGIGGSSKTRLIYHLAVGCVIGRLPWEWDVVTGGKAVLLLTEDTFDDVHRVIHYMVADMGLNDWERERMVSNLVIIPLAGKSFKLLCRTPSGCLEKTATYHALVAKIIQLGGVVFVGIDPALSVTDGDELDQGHQRAMGKMIDDMAIQTGATCALVSHATKASLNTIELNSHNSRGGGAVTDAVRAEYSLRNMTTNEAAKAKIDDPEEKKRIVQLVCTKANALPPSAFVPVWLRRNDSGSLSEADISFSENVMTQNDSDILKVLIELSETATPNLSDWRAECIEKGLITGSSEAASMKALERVRRRLQAFGMIQKGIGRGIWIPEKNDPT